MKMIPSLRPLKKFFRQAVLSTRARFPVLSARWALLSSPHPESDLEREIERIDFYTGLDDVDINNPQELATWQRYKESQLVRLCRKGVDENRRPELLKGLRALSNYHLYKGEVGGIPKGFDDRLKNENEDSGIDIFPLNLVNLVSAIYQEQIITEPQTARKNLRNVQLNLHQRYPRAFLESRVNPPGTRCAELAMN